MIVICDCGATKGDWRVVEEGRQLCRVLSAGVNVSTMDREAIGEIIRGAAAQMPSGPYEEVHYYSAGVYTPDIKAWMTELLEECFQTSAVEIQTDLVAAARAACGHEPGIAVILGTGSNSCEWDGENIIKRVNSGGFILGDDGSASVLGKQFIADFLKGLVPKKIADEFSARFPSDYATIVQNVYHNPGSPSAYLGSFCPFILSHYSDPYIKGLVDGNLQACVDRCLKQYAIDRYPVGIVGGFGNALKDIITPLFEKNGIRIRAFIPSPIEELIHFHSF